MVARLALVMLVSAVGLSGLSASARAGQTGSLEGRLLDAEGQITFPGNAVVFLCDAATGMPIVAETIAPLKAGLMSVDSLDDFAHVVTTTRGRFKFVDVHPGRYRLVAQSWSGTSGLPPSGAKYPSVVVVLHGVAEHVEVRANETAQTEIRALGDEALKITNDPPEGHALLLISRGRRLGDGVLGPAAWGTEFIAGVIGVTWMEQPYVTFVGLPDGAEIHTGLFNIDNNAGVGGDSYVVGQASKVRLEIFATWSNGKFDPPARLARLTDHLAERGLSASQLVGLAGIDRDNADELFALLRSEHDRIIKVEGIGDFQLADVLAASRYRSLREYHKKRIKP